MTQTAEDSETTKEQEATKSLIQLSSTKSIEILTVTHEHQVMSTQQEKRHVSRLVEKGKQLQISLPSDTTPQSQIVAQQDKMVEESIRLDEVITLPMYDLNNLTLEQMKELQTLLSHKAKQEQLRRENKKIGIT